MTAGHKHRHITVPSEDHWLARLLRGVVLLHSTNLDRVERSPYPYGPCTRPCPEMPPCYRLTLLGFLHRWTGLTLFIPDKEE